MTQPPPLQAQMYPPTPQYYMQPQSTMIRCVPTIGSPYQYQNRYKNPIMSNRPRLYNQHYVRHQQQREATYNTENYQVPSVIKEKQFDHFDEITNKTNISSGATGNNLNSNLEGSNLNEDADWAYVNEKVDYK